MSNGDSKIWISGDLLLEEYKDVMISIQEGKPYRKAPVKGFMASPMLRIRDMYGLTEEEIETLTPLLEAYVKKSGDLPTGITLSGEARNKVFLKVEEKKKPETAKVVKIPAPKKRLKKRKVIKTDKTEDRKKKKPKTKKSSFLDNLKA